MAKEVLTSVKILYQQYDLTGDLNQATLRLLKDAKDSTVFNSSSIARLSGMRAVEATFAGFAEHDTGKVSKVIYDDLGTADRIFTFCPTGYATGDYVYSTKAAHFRYEEGMEVGEMYTFGGAMLSGGTAIVRGRVAATGAKTASGDGTAYELGALTSGKTLYAAVHCTAVSGSGPPTCDIKIQSDDASGFATPTDRITFSTITNSATAEWSTYTTTTAETWWRATWTIAGTVPSYTIYVIMAIQ